MKEAKRKEQINIEGAKKIQIPIGFHDLIYGRITNTKWRSAEEYRRKKKPRGHLIRERERAPNEISN